MDEIDLKSIKAIIFDRDGTINIPMPAVPNTKNTGYVLSISEFKFLPNVLDGLSSLYKKGFKLHVFTQQKAVGKGLITEEELNNIHDHMREELDGKAGVKLGSILYCPHIGSDCDCTKPKPGMILEILKENNLKPHEVLVIGDTIRDIPDKSLTDEGMQFIAVPNPDSGASSNKLDKKDWQDKGYYCVDDLLELSKLLYKPSQKQKLLPRIRN